MCVAVLLSYSESFWGLGWLVAALVSRFIIPDFGWHAAFLIGGIPASICHRNLENGAESVPYLINRGRFDEAHALVKKIEAKCGVEVIEIFEVKPVADKHNISFTQLVVRYFCPPYLNAVAHLVRYRLFLLWHFYLVTKLIGQRRLHHCAIF